MTFAFVYTFCFQEKVVDLVLLEDEGDSVVKMMMVTQRQTKVENDSLDNRHVETLLQIREFPSFKVLYELQVSRHLFSHYAYQTLHPQP